MLLASVVHHSDWMLGFLEKDPSHPFSLVPILSSPLLQELKANHVTLVLNEHVPTVTGIPPHVAHMRQINSVKETCEEIKMELQGMREGLKTIIHEAIDEKVESSGGINTALLDKRLGDMEKRLSEKMDTLENFQSVKPLTCVPLRPNLVDASEEPIVATCNQFFLSGSVLVCPGVILFTTRDLSFQWMPHVASRYDCCVPKCYLPHQAHLIVPGSRLSFQGCDV